MDRQGCCDFRLQPGVYEMVGTGQRRASSTRPRARYSASQLQESRMVTTWRGEEAMRAELARDMAALSIPRCSSVGLATVVKEDRA